MLQYSPISDVITKRHGSTIDIVNSKKIILKHKSFEKKLIKNLYF